MKLKLILLLGLPGAVGALASSRVSWIQNPATDNVVKYILQHRPVAPTNAPWTTVEVLGTTNTVDIPEDAFGRWFRIAAANSLGQSEWTEPAKLPEKVNGMKITIEITP